MSSGGEYGNQRHAAAERRKRVVELRDEGLTFREIADQLGVGVASAWRHYQTAMRLIPAEAVARHAETLERRRAEQLERIDMERDEVMGVLAARHLVISGGNVVRPIIGTDADGAEQYGEPILDDAPVLAAVAALIKLDDQEAKLLGMYETKISHSGGVRHEWIGIDPESIL